MGRRTRMFLLKLNSNRGWRLFETQRLCLHGTSPNGRARKVQRGMTYEAVWLSGRLF
jgi:hypothetical protein